MELKVLVTGANGFVGSNLCAYLGRNGVEVVRSDVKDSDINGDLTDSTFVFNDLKKYPFDAVVHLAGIVSVPRSIEDPYNCYRVNCFGTANLLEMASAKKVDRFIYASSNNVYGLPRKLPVEEEDQFSPRSPYDYSKVVGEHFVRSFQVHGHLPTVVLRSWKMFGPHDVPTAAVPRFVKACFSNSPIQLYNGGKDTNDVYYVDNYSQAVMLALKSPKAVGEAFNVGTGSEISVRKLAEMIRDLTGSSSKLETLPPRTQLEARPMRTRPSIRKIQRVLGYKPAVGLKKGLLLTVEWYRQQSSVSP